MIEKILELAKDYIQNTVSNTAEIPVEKKENVSDTIISSVKENIQGEVNSGLDINGLIHLFGQGTQSGFYKNTETSIISSLINKTGLDPKLANALATTLLPGLINFIKEKYGNNLLGNILGKLGI